MNTAKLKNLMILAVWGLFLSPEAYSIQCAKLVDSKRSEIRAQINTFQKELQQERKTLESELHENLGTISPRLEKDLHELFLLGELKSKHEVIKSIDADFITKNLSEQSKIKLYWLVQSKYARPYMSVLIVRYMNTVENNQNISFKNLTKIKEVVKSYILERALLVAKRRLDENPHKENSEDVLRYYRGENIYNPNGVNYKFPNNKLILSNFFSEVIRTVENEIASMPPGH